MATTIERRVAASPRRTWETVCDFGGYGRVIPSTRMSHDPGPPGLGWRFTGHTRVGPLAFDDPMRITRWEPGGDAGGRFEIVKEGRVLAGWARVEVTPAPGGSTLRWVEEIRPAPGPRAEGVVGPVADLATRVLFGRAVAGLARIAESA